MKTEKQPSRLSLPKSGIERLYLIDAEIASGRYPNTKYLAQKCSEGRRDPYSTSTISRDIEFMRDRLRAPIEYDAGRRGDSYTIKAFRLFAETANPLDPLSHSMKESLLALYQNTPLYAPEPKAQAVAGAATDWSRGRIMVPPVAASPVAEEIWNTIISENA